MIMFTETDMDHPIETVVRTYEGWKGKIMLQTKCNFCKGEKKNIVQNWNYNLKRIWFWADVLLNLYHKSLIHKKLSVIQKYCPKVKKLFSCEKINFQWNGVTVWRTIYRFEVVINNQIYIFFCCWTMNILKYMALMNVIKKNLNTKIFIFNG